MKSKSVLRRLEQLEKRAKERCGGVILLILDHEPTAQELRKYSGYDQIIIIIEDELRE